MLRNALALVLLVAGGYSAPGQTFGLRMPDTLGPVSAFSIRNSKQARSLATTPQPITPDFYALHLPFFCRQELKMQRRHIPVTFRLGSMELCNRLEQKPAYR